MKPADNAPHVMPANGENQPLVEHLQQRNAELEQKLDKLQQEVQDLKARNKLLYSILYGKSSEKQKQEPEPVNQLHLSFDEAEAEEPPQKKPETVSVGGHERKKPGRRPLPVELPRVDDVRDLPAEEKVCACGCEKKHIGNETSERLDIVPAKIQVIRTIRRKYACPKCEGTTENEKAVAIAPLVPQIIPQGIVTAGVLAHVIVAKFVDATPLYRQEQQFLRLGLDISRGTLSSWVLQVAAACYLLGELLKEDLRSGPVINMDETPVQVLKEPGRADTTRSYMWVCRGGPPERPVVIFRYSPTREARVAQEILGRYQGYLQTDGYSGYELIGQQPGVRHLGCLVHVRRKFVEVQKGANSGKAGVAQEALDLIGQLYGVERQADAKKLDFEQRKALRDQESAPILKKLKAVLTERAKTTPPKSLLGQAITYALNQWDRLVVYLEDGRLRPDNNLAENAIRPFVVGRKNWLFSGSPRGAESSALLYSLIETAKANGLDPYAYLRFLFTELPKARLESDIRALLPQHLDRSRLTVTP